MQHLSLHNLPSDLNQHFAFKSFTKDALAADWARKKSEQTPAHTPSADPSRGVAQPGGSGVVQKQCAGKAAIAFRWTIGRNHAERFLSFSCASQPFSFPAIALFVATAGGLFYYFKLEKAKVEERRAAESANVKVGRPRIGGPFELIAAGPGGQGFRMTHQDLEGSFSLIYFGFTNCPDICPEELDKMGEVVDTVGREHGPIVQPIFVSCDPARDTVPAVSKYIADFHPRMIGLTGSYDAVKAACKAYRVYFSTPPSADPNSDYLVDHSIFFYLMDPEGRFVDAFGRASTAEEVSEKVLKYIKQWKEGGYPVGTADIKQRIQSDPSRKVA
ncbi:Cu-binding protein [Tilletia horrida]|nr:Cu-binding protein [Tilletia horrida]